MLIYVNKEINFWLSAVYMSVNAHARPIRNDLIEKDRSYHKAREA